MTPQLDTTARWGVLSIFLVAVALATTLPSPAAAQTPDCGDYLGLTCEGLFTDEPDVVDDPAQVTAAVERVAATHGNPFAIVIASDTRGQDPVDFAVNLANDWGVGDPVEENGILILVAIAERRTEVVTQPAIELPGAAIANSARSFFAAGDFDGGVNAMIGAVDVVLSGGSINPASDGGGGLSGWMVLAFISIPAGILAYTAAIARRKARRGAKRSRRNRTIDASISSLDPRGDEIDLVRTFRLDLGPADTVDTGKGLDALARIDTDRASRLGSDVIAAVSSEGAASVIDVMALHNATRVPLSLRSSGERPILEDGLEVAIVRAGAVGIDDDRSFDAAISEIEDLVASLRPHRVAAARRRAADSLRDSLVKTAAGPVALMPFGIRMLKAAPVLDPTMPFADSAAMVRDAGRVAADKLSRLVAIRDHLADTEARDVASVALADATTDPGTAITEFETVLDSLGEHGGSLRADSLSLPAIAALLIVNNSASDIPGFIAGYDTLRKLHEPHVALEGALAGLFTSAELDAARKTADHLGLPVSIAVALGRRRDDGASTYSDLLGAVRPIAASDDARVIAGILAISLEPTVAFDRWNEARAALTSLGLTGSYADVAAAFGASDPRGPRAFALAYAAQRTALEDAGYHKLTRFAPELAHDGTSAKRDTWTERPLDPRPTDFDPFTFFYLHWTAIGGRHRTSGWDGLYSSRSWSDGGSSWWGGGGHFGGSGGSSWGSGGSSWGGSSGGFGGGFGGGGGFSGGGGGGW